MIHRQITSFNPAQPTTDGAGVAIQRVAVMGLSSVDPVLMIDELKSPFRGLSGRISGAPASGYANAYLHARWGHCA